MESMCLMMCVDMIRLGLRYNVWLTGRDVKVGRECGGRRRGGGVGVDVKDIMR
jgi:hypothetical protein